MAGNAHNFVISITLQRRRGLTWRRHHAVDGKGCVTMKKLHRVWSDPVFSKVIASAIVGTAATTGGLAWSGRKQLLALIARVVEWCSKDIHASKGGLLVLLLATAGVELALLRKQRRESDGRIAALKTACSEELEAMRRDARSLQAAQAIRDLQPAEMQVMQYLVLEDGGEVNISDIETHLQVRTLRAQRILRQLGDDTQYIEAGEKTCRLTERGRDYVLHRHWV